MGIDVLRHFRNPPAGNPELKNRDSERVMSVGYKLSATHNGCNQTVVDWTDFSGSGKWFSNQPDFHNAVVNFSITIYDAAASAGHICPNGSAATAPADFTIHQNMEPSQSLIHESALTPQQKLALQDALK